MVENKIEKSSYRSILKATSTFGGLQIFLILISLVKGKLVAVLLGATGVGINSLFNSSLSMITTISGLGLNSSAVREISQSYESGDIDKLSKTVKVFKTLLKYCSIFGVVILCSFSPLLSKITFGNYNYILSFILLSIVLVSTLLTQGNTSLLQGTRKLNYTAKSTLIGSIISLCLSIPLYYFFGINGIVPALILASIGTYLVSRYFSKKLFIKTQYLRKDEILSSGKEMAKLGIAMIIAQLLGQMSVFLLNSFISKNGGVADVGFFQAAMSMTTQAVTLVFAAMGADYYPRLVAVCNDKVKLSETVNQQGEILILIASPILLFLMIFSPIIIYILLSPEFFVITDIIRLISFGMLFKVVSYSIGYISFAKGDRKTFLLLEGIYGNISQLTFNIIGYILAGLKGLAFSFILIFVIYFILVSIVAYKKYNYKISKSYFKTLFPIIIFSCTTLIISSSKNQLIVYGLGSIMIVFSVIFSYKELNKRIDFKYVFKKILKK